MIGMKPLDCACVMAEDQRVVGGMFFFIDFVAVYAMLLYVY